MPKLKITWQKSANGYPRDQRETLRALGLRRRGQTIFKEDSPSIRGMVDKVRHLVQAEPVEE